VSARRHELQAIGVQPVPGTENIVGAQRHVLYALAPILLNEFLDLIDLLAALLELRLVDRDPDLAARRGQRPAREPGVFPVISKYWCSRKLKTR